MQIGSGKSCPGRAAVMMPLFVDRTVIPGSFFVVSIIIETGSFLVAWQATFLSGSAERALSLQEICAEKNRARKSGTLPNTKGLCSQQALVESKESFVDLKNIVILVFDKIFDNNIKFTGM